MFLAIVVVALAGYEKAAGSKVKDVNHGKSKPAAHVAKPTKHAPKSVKVANSGGAEPEIDDRYEHLMGVDWNLFEENKNNIN